MLQLRCFRILLSTLFVCSPLVLTAQQIYTSISVPTASTNSVVEGQLFTLTTTLGGLEPSQLAGTNGLPVYFEGLSGGCTGTLQNGVASCQLAEYVDPTQQPPYHDYIFAVFSGNATYGSSTSDGYAYIGIVTPGSYVGPALQGAYALYFDGYTDAGTGAKRVAGLASLTADGNGNLKGILDYNSALTGVLTKVPVTGTYAIYTAGNGSLKLSSAMGTLSFDIFTGLPVTTGVKSASLMETDQNILYGTAKMRAQTISTGSTASTPSQQININLTGETACTACSAQGNASIPVLTAGTLTLSGTYNSQASGSFQALFDQTAGSSVATLLSGGGTYTVPDATGRMVFKLNTPDMAAGAPSSYVGYAVDAVHYFLLSTDPHSEYILLSGEGASQ